MSNRETAFARITSTGNLPSPPSILLNLLKLCNNHDVELADIANIVQKDPAISSEVLRLANSSYYGFSRPITDLQQAVVYLGAKTIQDLIVTMSIHQAFERKRQNSVADCDSGNIWYHSLFSAAIAKRIQQKTGSGNSDDIYLAALLHDIGKLILTSSFPNKYKLVAENSGSAESTTQAELHHIGITHCEAGAWLINQWNLPSLLGDAILYHHHPVKQITSSLEPVQIVYCANLLAQDSANNRHHYDCCHTILGLEAEIVDEVRENAREEVEELAEQLGIQRTAPSAQAGKNKDGPDQNDEELVNHVKNLSILTTLLDNLGQATDTEAIILAVEKSLHLLFAIEKTMFLLPDSEELVLSGVTSATNPLEKTCKAIRMPLLNSSSRIVAHFHKETSPSILHPQNISGNLADLQLLRLFGGINLLITPLIAGNKPMGLILAEVSDQHPSLSKSEIQLLQTLARHAALRLSLEAQKRQQEQQLQEERMAAASLAARKFAHELNNPLGIISNYLSGLQLKLHDHKELQHELTCIDEEIQRIASMLGQMHMFAQAPLSDFEPLDLNILVHSLVHLGELSFFSDPGKTVSFVPATDLPSITTSRNGIKQILINLLKNSAEAMDNGGRVIVRTKTLRNDNANTPFAIALIVSDTGPGLPATIRENLYEPFRSTKENGNSGLGLSIVKKTVQDLGGKLTYTTGDEGTTITIVLPAEYETRSNSR